MTKDNQQVILEFFQNFFAGKVDEELVNRFATHSRIVTREKGEVVFGPEATGPSTTFLLDGVMKTYILCPDGTENTYAIFFKPGTAVCLTKDMINNTGINMKTLTKTTYIELVGAGPWELVEEYPDLYRELLYGILPLCFGMLDKLRAGYTMAAKERYLWFLNKYGPVVNQISLTEIAKYLGIQPQSLSRIRSELAAEENKTL